MSARLICATIWRDYQPYKQGLVPRRAFVRRLTVDQIIEHSLPYINS
ncbi:MAG: hypothetical protein HY781_00045 [Chloroflexi bacterium]|nr:hypothetical protein [Chloroflexota bacterium]